MVVKTNTLSLETRGQTDIIDISHSVTDILSGTGLKDGIVTIFCPSSTSALTTIEYESGCLGDLKRLFEQIVPKDIDYAHNARWGDGNGYSHLRATLLGASLTVPFTNGRLNLGVWQQIIFIDFDNKPRHRDLLVQVLGE